MAKSEINAYLMNICSLFENTLFVFLFLFTEDKIYDDRHKNLIDDVNGAH